jgi:hypothetical protein
VSEEPTTPADVWALIERADELIKYASNRDPKTAYAQARETLQKAIDASCSVPGAAPLEKQARTRLDDIERLEEGSPS